MGSIFSFIIVIPASIIGGFFINEMFQYISFFGLTQQQKYFKALKLTQKQKLQQDKTNNVAVVTNSEFKD